ncbi:MAG: 50S ribosomal protein L30e [archaeon]
MVDLNKEIRRAVDTGKVEFGIRVCQKTLAKGEGELIIVSSNMPVAEKERLQHLANVNSKKFITVPENGLVLGSICGKPFVISAMIVLDAGKSNILEA